MKLWSILIPTMEDRKPLYDKMVADLQKQIAASHAEDEIEIVPSLDKGELTIGTKRNMLLQMAKGKFSSFLDDDDPVVPTYVEEIIAVLRVYDDLDSVGIFEEVYFQDKYAGIGIHSILCDTWTEVPDSYYRCLDQRTPVRTELARKIKYQDIRWSEDHHWSVAVAKSGMFKKEVFLGHKPLYIYKCREKKKGL